MHINSLPKFSCLGFKISLTEFKDIVKCFVYCIYRNHDKFVV